MEGAKSAWYTKQVAIAKARTSVCPYVEAVEQVHAVITQRAAQGYFYVDLTKVPPEVVHYLKALEYSLTDTKTNEGWVCRVTWFH